MTDDQDRKPSRVKKVVAAASGAATVVAAVAAIGVNACDSSKPASLTTAVTTTK